MTKSRKNRVFNWLFKRGVITNKEKENYTPRLRDRVLKKKEEVVSDFININLTNTKIDDFLNDLKSGAVTYTKEEIICFINTVESKIKN